MKKIFTLVIPLMVAGICFGQQFTPVDAGTEIGFTIKNFGIKVNGHFSGIQGKIIFHPDSLQASLFDVKVDASTINTRIDQRDNHLRSEDYFEVEKYPFIHFVSQRVTRSTNKDYLFVFGKLTIKDVTREISFPFKVTPQAGELIFEGEFSLDRRDYHVGGRSLTLSDNVVVHLKVLAKAGN